MLRIGIFVGTALLAALVSASGPISNLQVTLRGKRYDISDVTTVGDLRAHVEKESGVPVDQQGRLLFGGKRLELSDILSEVGVADGAQLNMVPAATATKSKTSKKISTESVPSDASSVTESDAATAASSEGSSDDSTSNLMQEYLKQAGVDTDKLNEMIKGMGTGSGANGLGGGGMPSLKESMETMTSMMNSPIFQEYMNDPEKLEQSRQMILNNPMLKGMMAGMPGMNELLNDPVAWREAMLAAANLYKNLDSDQLTQAMMGAGLGGPNSGSGLFDGILDSPSAATAALDELDEDDD